MTLLPRYALDYHRPISLAYGVHWVGFHDQASGLHCNPYLVTDGAEAVIIDPGSRPQFSSVMMKVLDIVEPSSISAIVLQHYDPDLCGCVPVLEELIGNPELRIISHRENNPFISHYGVQSPLVCFEDIGSKLTFASGRELHFHRTPFAHSSGSFVTHDTHTGVLFTSDLFGSYSQEWELFKQFSRECRRCSMGQPCPADQPHCDLSDIIAFHRSVMTSSKALRNAMQLVRRLAPVMVAPQHGSVLFNETDIKYVTDVLHDLDGVGIDGYEVAP